MAQDYFKRVVEVNKKIIHFNKNYKEIDEEYERRELMEKFIEELAKDNYVNEIVEWDKRNKIRNLWYLIRNPCYT